MKTTTLLAYPPGIYFPSSPAYAAHGFVVDTAITDLTENVEPEIALMEEEEPTGESATMYEPMPHVADEPGGPAGGQPGAGGRNAPMNDCFDGWSAGFSGKEWDNPWDDPFAAEPNGTRHIGVKAAFGAVWDELRKAWGYDEHLVREADEVAYDAIMEDLDDVAPTGGPEFRIDDWDEKKPRETRGRGRRHRKARIANQAHRGYGWAVHAARAAKAKFGIVEHNKANVFVVSGFIRNWLAEHKVDEQVRGDVAAIAIAVFWVPTETEKFVMRVEASAGYAEDWKLRDSHYRIEARKGVLWAFEKMGLLRPKRVYARKPTG